MFKTRGHTEALSAKGSEGEPTSQAVRGCAARRVSWVRVVSHAPKGIRGKKTIIIADSSFPPLVCVHECVCAAVSEPESAYLCESIAQRGR